MDNTTYKNFLGEDADYQIGGDIVYIDEKHEMFGGRVKEVNGGKVLVSLDWGEEVWADFDQCI